MSQIFDRKRFWLVLGVLVLVELAVLTLVRCPRTVPESECGEVYQRYVHHEGVEATFVKGFPVNDTVSVDVTLLRAADSAGWECLMREFNVPEEMRELARTNPDIAVSERLGVRGHPETRAALKGRNRVPGLTMDDVEICAIDFHGEEVCVFHTRNAKEIEAVRNYDFDKMTDNKQP